MTYPIGIPSLKAAALAAKDRFPYALVANPAAVLALIERLETAEHRLTSLGYRRTCDIPACNCGDQWAHKLACPIKCSCDKCELDRAGIALDILRDELRADRARLEKLEAVATAARRAAGYHDFDLMIDSAAHALLLALAALEAP